VGWAVAVFALPAGLSDILLKPRRIGMVARMAQNRELRRIYLISGYGILFAFILGLYLYHLPDFAESRWGLRVVLGLAPAFSVWFIGRALVRGEKPLRVLFILVGSYEIIWSAACIGSRMRFFEKL
jgi:hypothetical protein